MTHIGNFKGRMLVAFLTLGTFAVLGSYPKPGMALTINFDDVASGTNINTQYSASGITLGCFNGNNASFNACTTASTGGNAFAQTSVLAESASNVISLSPNATFAGFTDEHIGFFQAHFSSPVSYGSIDAKPVLPPEHLGTTTADPFLAAYDSSGQLRATAVYIGDVTQEQYHTLEINRTEGDIAFIVFSSYYAAGSYPVYGVFDNLDPSAAPIGDTDYARDAGTPGGGTPMPEPATLLLMSGSVAALSLLRRRRK